jgi:hypothetical protein
MKSLLYLFAVLSLPSPTVSEFRRFDGPINAASNYIHFSEGYVITPGYIDISNLVFASADEGAPNTYIPEDRDWNDDHGAVVEESRGDDRVPDDDENNNNRDRHRHRQLEESIGDNTESAIVSGSTYVDIVLFHEPPECANTRVGCDWTELGVGANDGLGNLRWCCSDDAIGLGLCRGGAKQEGRLIVDPDKFNGQHRFLGVPPSGIWSRAVKFGMFDLKEKDGSGKYSLIVANCNDVIGRNLTVTGDYVWKSSHGYLPGNLFGEMYFYFVVAILYLVLLVWYAIKYNIYKDSAIPIFKWVMATIFIGFMESFFKCGDLWVWNVDGVRFWFSLYTGVLFGVCKRAISRVLVVMLCLGWGVTCDTLGGKFKTLVVLGLVYAGVSAARDVMTIISITENEILSHNEEEEILDVVSILTFVTAFIDVTFYLWIFDALNQTMQYLESMNQTRKLKRYLRLRLFLLLSVLFAILWSVFGIVDSYNSQRMVNEEENGWVLTAVWEVNYFVVLMGLSCLWAPEAGAKEYAYVMELSTLGNDLEFDTNVVDGSPDDDSAEEEEMQFNNDGVQA